MSSKPLVLVTGKTGQLGQSFLQLHAHSEQAQGFRFSFLDREQLDLSRPESVQSALESHQADVVINCAAYTLVDKAEDEPKLANAVNALSVGEIANWCARKNARLVHFSTDYVYDGKSNTAFRETDAPNALNEYGKSKLAGEKVIQQQMTDYQIFRTSWVHSAYGNNFLKRMLRLFSERDLVKVVADQIGAPTYAMDLASMVLNHVLSVQGKKGIYNLCNTGFCSWYDFAKYIDEKTSVNSKLQIVKITSDEFPTKATRPKNSRLNMDKFQADFGQAMPTWQSGADRCMLAFLGKASGNLEERL